MMLEGKTVLAVVPARSGSKGIPDKNMRTVGGVSLIALAGRILGEVGFLDERVISTDSEAYREEGIRNGLSGPFLRPRHLSTDQATAIETLRHALQECERHFQSIFDIVLLIEPTCPLRKAEDIEAAAGLLARSGADSVVTVSEVPTKYHPDKLLKTVDGRLDFVTSEGRRLTERQQLQGKFNWRNGACYALTRRCILEVGEIITRNTLPLVIERPLINIDDPEELEYANWLIAARGSGGSARPSR